MKDRQPPPSRERKGWKENASVGGFDRAAIKSRSRSYRYGRQIGFGASLGAYITKDKVLVQDLRRPSTGTAGVVAAIAFVPIAGFFMTGTSAKIPAGGGVKGFLNEDLTIAAPQPAPAAEVVQAAAPASAAATAQPR